MATLLPERKEAQTGFQVSYIKLQELHNPYLIKLISDVIASSFYKASVTLYKDSIRKENSKPILLLNLVSKILRNVSNSKEQWILKTYD